MGLLEGALTKGWSERRRKRFISQYGPFIVHCILYLIRAYFGPEGLNVIRAHLEALLRGEEVNLEGEVKWRPLDVAFNTYQDVLAAAFKEEDNLIQKYQPYRSNMSFEAFLRKNVEYKFMDSYSAGYPSGRSPKEILDAMVNSRREEIKRFYITMAYERFREQVKLALRAEFPQLSNRAGEGNVTCYFFEVFVPRAYPLLKEQMTSRSKGRALLDELMEYFSEEDYRAGLKHRCRILLLEEETIPNTDYPSRAPWSIPLEEEAAFYWDKLIRCEDLEPQEVASRLLLHTMKALGKVEEDKLLCCALADQKGDLGQQAENGSSRAQTQRENLKMWIVWRCSQSGKRRDGPPPEELRPETLSLEQVTGRYFRWEEDVCKGIFQRNVRQDRVEEQIAEFIKQSRWLYFIS